MKKTTNTFAVNGNKRQSTSILISKLHSHVHPMNHFFISCFKTSSLGHSLWLLGQIVSIQTTAQQYC